MSEGGDCAPPARRALLATAGLPRLYGRPALPPADRPWPERTGAGVGSAKGACPPSWWWRKRLTARSTTLLADLMALVSPRRARRPDVAAALDVQKPASADDGAAGARPQDQPHSGGRTAQAAEIQPTGQPQDTRRGRPSRP